MVFEPMRVLYTHIIQVLYRPPIPLEFVYIMYSYYKN